MRPGLLTGEREQERSGEKFASAVLGVLPRWLAPASLRLYRDEVVARVTIRAATGTATGVEIVAGGEIFERAG
jgi:hypothetical protein